MAAVAASAEVDKGKRRGRPFDRAAFDQAEAYIFDCDEAIWDSFSMSSLRNREEVEATILDRINALIASGKRVLFVCHSTATSRRSYVQKLVSKGIRICDPSDPAALSKAERNIISAGKTAACCLREIGVKRPFILTSDGALLEDLRSGGVTDYVASVADDGQALEGYDRALTDHTLARLAGELPEVDCMVVGGTQELTCMQVAVASRCLRRTRDALIEGGGEITSVPLLTACPPEQKRKLRALVSTSMCRALGASVDIDAGALDVRMPSDALLLALPLPEDKGGYGLDMAKTLILGTNLDTTITFGNRGGMMSVLVLNSIRAQMDVSLEMRDERLPDWVLPSLAQL